MRGFRFLSYEARTLERAVSILAGAALLSSILALLRDRLLAHTFGAGVELDLYNAAFQIPDLLFVSIGALVSVYILIPELARRGSEGEKDYIDTVLAGFSALAVVASITAALAAPVLLAALFPVFVGSSAFDTLVLLTRIILLQPVILGLSNILASVTQVRSRYALYALCPILYNAGIIGGILFLYPLFGLQGLAWGVVLGACLHVGVQIPSLVSDGFFRRVPRIVEAGALRRTFSVSIPRALTLSLNQIGLIGLIALAGAIASGSIAVFKFAFNLNSVPLAVIGASYSVAAFPTLAKAFSGGDREKFVEQVLVAARHVIFWSLPTIALLVVLRAHIVRVVLGSGAFDWTDTRLTAALFALFAFSLVAQGLMLLLVRGYYAAGKTLAPLLISLASATGMITLGYIFLRALEREDVLQFAEVLMRVEDLEGTSVLALALAYSVASILAVLVLAIHFEYTFGRFFKAVQRTFLEGVIAGFAGALSAYAILYALGPLTIPSTLLSVFLRGFAAGVVGIATVALVHALLGSREFGETIEAIRLKLWRRRERDEITVTSSAEDVGPGTHQ